MIDTKHENAIKVKEWFDKSGIELSCSDEVVVEIYKDISYYGKIVNSISLKERTHVMKMQISFIRKNILGLMYKENNSAKGIKGGYHSGIEMFMIVEDDSVKVIWNEV